MTEYLADHYLKLPNYLTIDGHPVFVVWDVKGLIKANGGPAGFARTLARMNDVLRRRAMKDLYLVSIVEQEPTPEPISAPVPAW